MSHQFIEIDRSPPITLPGNLEGWLDGNDLAHFIVEVVESLDTSVIEGAYPHHLSVGSKPWLQRISADFLQWKIKIVNAAF